MNSARITALFCLLLAFVQALPAGETIQITTGEYAPWTSEKLKKGGFTSHVISQAFKVEGYDVAFEFFPWKRAYKAAKPGHEFQATAWWYPSTERAKYFLYSEPLLFDDTVFFYLKDNRFPDWETLDDLVGKRIGATRGYTYIKEFWDAAKSGRLDIQEANSDQLNFKKLLAGRIDTFPTSYLVGLKLLKERFRPEEFEDVTSHPKPLVSAPGHLLISKKAKNAKELMEKFNRGLASLKESGRYDQFMADFVAGEYEQ
jgi:polar amino acid transport system substrate-binding protein